MLLGLFVALGAILLSEASRDYAGPSLIAVITLAITNAP